MEISGCVGTVKSYNTVDSNKVKQRQIKAHQTPLFNKSIVKSLLYGL